MTSELRRTRFAKTASPLRPKHPGEAAKRCFQTINRQLRRFAAAGGRQSVVFIASPLRPYRGPRCGEAPMAVSPKGETKPVGTAMPCGNCPFFSEIGAFPNLVGRCLKSDGGRETRDEMEFCDKGIEA